MTGAIPSAAQSRRVADARQHQQLRRAEGAERNDGLAASPQLPLDAALEDFRPDCALAVEQQPQRARLGLHSQVRPLAEMRMDVAARGAPAFAVELGDLIDAEPLLALAVEIGVERELGLARGVEKARLERIVGAQIGDVERPALAVIGVVKVSLFSALRK